MDDDAGGQARPGESEDERYDRELIELLNEVRVAMPGVQILFGFLLAVPFQQRFAQTTTFQRDVYIVTLLSAAAATAFLIAPVAYHRIMFRRRDKPKLIVYGNESLIIGLACLALSMSSAVLLIVDVIFSLETAIVLAGAVALLIAGLWFAIGFVRRVTSPRSEPR